MTGRWWPGAVLALAVLAGCSGGDDASSSSGSTPPGGGSSSPGQMSSANGMSAAPSGGHSGGMGAPGGMDDELAEDTDVMDDSMSKMEMSEVDDELAGYPGFGPGPQMTPRPEDLSAWQPDDYKSALAEGDPRLEAAVAQLGQRPGDAEAAGLLASLLEEFGRPAGQRAGAGGGFPPSGAAIPGFGGPGGRPGGSGPPAGYGGPPAGYGGPPAGFGGPPAGFGGPPTGGPPTGGPPAGYGGPPAGYGGPPAGPGAPGGGHGAPTQAGGPAAGHGPPMQPGPGAGHGAPQPGGPGGPGGGHGAPMPPGGSGGPASGHGPPMGALRPARPAAFPASPVTLLAAAAVGQVAGPPGAGHAAAMPGYDPAMSEMEDESYPGDGYGQPRQAGRDTIFRAIVNALMANGAPGAWQTIERLLKGEINTGLDDKLVVDEVLAALLAHYGGPEHPTGRLLAQALAAPEQLRPAAGSPGMVTAAELKQKVLDLHTTSAASAVDALLGIPSEPPQGARQGRGVYGAMPGYPGMDEMEMEDYPGAGAPGYGPANPGGAGGQTTAAEPVKIDIRPVSPEEARRMLQYLSQPALLEAIETQLRSLPSLADAAAGRQLALAGSLPAQSLRVAEYELLQAQWTQGADALMAQKLFEAGPRDPGLLVVLKSLPQLKTLPLRQPSTPRAQQENQTKHSWATAVRQLVRTLNARFHAAALSRTTGGSAPPPIRLHQGANITAAYRMAWPDDADGEVPAAFADPFVVHYVRVEAGQVNPQQMLHHYERQVRGGKAAFAQNNFEAWIEHEGAAEDPARRISTDIMLTIGRGGGGGAPSAPGGADGRGERTQEVTIEVLSIEIPSPRTTGRNVAQQGE